jgi:hypothetical protein
VRKGGDGINALFWNVSGTRSLRKEDWDFIRGHEIVELVETWEEEGKEISRRELKGYEIRFKPAKREKKKGRAKGGIILAVKGSALGRYGWEEEDTDEALAVNWTREGYKGMWGVVYMRHKRKENYEVMNAWAEKHKDERCIITGDFNARTAEEEGLWSSDGEKETRSSKDKTVNEEGLELIKWLEENGLGIGNGTDGGDKEGEWTYIGARGCTTIDYVVRNEIARDEIEMKVGDRIKSDHLPLEVRLCGGNLKREEKRFSEKRKILVWDEKGEENYRLGLEKGERSNSWKSLKDKITAALPWKEIEIGGNVKKEEKWWDEECHR